MAHELRIADRVEGIDISRVPRLNVGIDYGLEFRSRLLYWVRGLARHQETGTDKKT